MTFREIPDIELLLIRHYDKSLSEEETQTLNRWMDASPDNKKTAEEIYKLCYMADVAKSESETDGAYREIRARIRSQRRANIFRRVQKVAAMLAVPLLGVSAYLLYAAEREHNAIIELNTTTGMVSSVTLPDNSKVWLNSNSTIKYPAKFSGRERRVELCGEAYFDVAEDKRNRFVVEAKNVEVEVYGTEFNIEAYGEEHIVRTTLVEGSVGLRYDAPGEQRQSLRMVPNQIASYDSRSKSLSVDSGNAQVNSSWKNGKIMLRDTSLEDALRIIGHKYNVSFSILDRRLLENTYIGTFTNQSLETIIKHFSMSSKIKFREVPPEQKGEISGRRVMEVY